MIVRGIQKLHRHGLFVEHSVVCVERVGDQEFSPFLAVPLIGHSGFQPWPLTLCLYFFGFTGNYRATAILRLSSIAEISTRLLLALVLAMEFPFQVRPELF
jgi:hypothetical protein